MTSQGARRPIEDVYPLSPVQQGMLFHTLYAPDSGVYLSQTSFRVSGEFDPSSFKRALAHVIERHAVLRTSFVWKDLDQPVQVVHREVPLPIREEDWSQLPEIERKQRLEEHLSRDAVQSFDLAQPPLLRFLLARENEGTFRLVWTIHLLLVDGWSTARMMSELFACYNAFWQGLAPQLEPSRRYRDYIAWLARQDAQQAESFWRRELSGFREPTPLPGDRGPGREPAAFQSSTLLGEKATDALQAFARANQLTVNSLIQGAWALLLSRMSGQQEVVFGVTHAGRPPELPGAEAMIGSFINTLPLRTDAAPETLIREWLRLLQDKNSEARQFGHVPLVEIQGWSELPRGVPLFDSILVFENYPVDAAARQGSSHLMIDDLRTREVTNFALTLIAIPGLRLALSLSWDRSRFDPDGIDRLLDHLVHLLDDMVGQPGARLESLDHLSPWERHQLLVEWNATGVEVPRLCIHNLLEAQAVRNPEKLAVVRGTERLTYRELNQQANRLAHHLTRLGVGPEVRVGIFVERAPSLVMTLLAVLKAGGAYVPLDPSYPEDRIGYMVEDAKVRVIVVGSGIEDKLPEQARASGAQMVRLGSGWQRLDNESTANPDSGVLPENLSYVIYTSGSTGRPKGVAIQHRNAVSLLTWALVEFGDEESAVVALTTSITFDISVFELFFTLARGSKLVVAENVLELPALSEAQEITLVNAVPTVMAELLRSERLPSSVMAVNLGGEAMQRSLVDEIYSHPAVRRVRNGYGPSENTSYTTLYPIERFSERIPPLGRPLGNCRMYLLAPHLELLPVGVPGELYVGGLGVARGYLDRPGLTAERFLPDPFGEQPGERMYKTGDIVRLLPDGQFEFLGRADHQVKIRGFRIELGEIEAVLSTLPGVNQAVVLVRDDTPGDPRLVAYVAGEAEAGALRQALRERLPDPMVPTAFVTLAAFPLTPNGKVDRKALPAPERQRSEESYPAPRTPVEDILAGIWSEFLGLERVGATDHFFDLGGHSLLATRLTARVREIFGIELPVRAVFEEPELAALARRIDAERRTGAGLRLPAIHRIDRSSGAPTPLSFAQERLWFLDRFEPDSPAYNMPAAVRLEGRLDLSALAASLNEVVRRHETLRTSFRIAQDGVGQVVASELRLALPVIDLRALPPAAHREAARRLGTEAARRPFDLAAGPLLRLLLLRLTDDVHEAVLTLHHIVADGWSISILVRELAALYAAFLAGRPSPLPALPIQYADFAAWQRQWLQGETLAAQLGWWRERLAGAPAVLTLPADRPRRAVQRFRGRSQFQRLALHGIGALGRETSATPFMILLAAFTALLARSSGQLDLVVGSPIASRTRVETEPLIGLFLNTLALRADLSGDPSVRELVRRIREVTLGAYAYQDLPFEKLVEDLSLERDLSHTPIFQVLLVLQNVPFEPLELPSLRLSPVGVDTATAKFDLVLNATEVDGGLSCLWIYNSDLFDTTRIVRLCGHFATLLEAALADPERRLSALPLLGEAERHQTLCEWNDSQAGRPATACLHELFAAQAERTPAAVAAFCGDECLTYRELLGRSRCWAEELVSCGVGPESVVAILAPRGLPFLTAVLAIFQAGGAYLPLDPYQPAARAVGMLRQSGARLLLSGGGLGPRLLAAVPEPPAVDILELERLMRLDGEAVALPLRAGLNHLAYVIYTSGSTGLPKGAMVHHRGLRNHALAKVEALGLTATDTVAQNASQSFDISVWQMLSALVSGGRVAIYPDETTHDPAALLAAVARDGVTVLEVVPSLLTAMVEAIEGGLQLDLSRLRWLIPTGEALSPELCRRWITRHPAIPLLNAYGPTECSDDVSHGPVLEALAASWHTPIGRPVANTQIYILDFDLHPQPLGVPGELCVGGEGVGRGYLSEPARTALAFVPDPFTGTAGGRLYRTGDMARWRAEGALEFLGRIDHQVKVRGFRIELGEIESVLATYPAVQQAVVDIRGAGTAQRLVAWVAADAADPDLAAGLRGHLQARLPDYMIPAAFVPVASLPRTLNGKVDRRALPDPEPGPAAGQDHAVPGTPLEQLLASLWREALAVESIGLHDSFFDLGGNSITGAILINRLQRELGEIIHVVTLFDAPTVAKMAAYLAREQRQAVLRLWGAESLGTGAVSAWRMEARRIDAAQVAALRALIRPLPTYPAAAEKNPPAVFVLSPPRSGSTLLRVMLGGHPRLFAPPELELLSFNTLADREAAFQGRDSFWLEGVIRAVMEVRCCGVEEARRIIGTCVEEGWTTQRFYRQLQEWLGDRSLVDKTPSYALDMAVLRRAEETFESSFYIHLVRNPYAAIRSFEEAKLDELFFRHPHAFSRTELAELIWLVSHQNIVELLSDVPAKRQLRIRFEDLVRNPSAELQRICAALGIEFHHGMTDPYQEGRARMTDGIHAEGRMLGDVKFLQYKAIEPRVAERWEEAPEGSLGEPTWEMAVRFGYERPSPTPPAVIPRVSSQEEPLPLSFAQQRLWFLDRLEPGSATYNLPAAVRFRGPLALPLLAATLTEIVRRHEVLRTSFPEIASQPAQVIATALEISLPVVDLTALPEELREVEARRIVHAQNRLPFDLARLPLLRVTLARLAEDDHIAAFTVHHIAFDGWSTGVLVRELGALYRAFLAGKPSPLPELPIQYADFAAWQRRSLQGKALESLVEHWRRRLAGAPPRLDLIGARPRPEALSSRGAERHRRFVASLLEQVRTVGRRESMTLFMILLAPLQALLHAQTGLSDIVVGTDVAGRNRPETEGLIGFFVNQLPLRTDLSGDPTLRELLGRVRKTALAAYAHQDLPFDHLVDMLRIKRSLQQAPVFQVKLVLQNARQDDLDLPGLTLQAVSMDTDTAQLDLHWSAAEVGGELWLTLTYSTDLYDASRIERLLDQYAAWLQALVERPDARLGEVAAELAGAERAWRAERDLGLKSKGLGKLRELRRQAESGETPDQRAPAGHLQEREV